MDNEKFNNIEGKKDQNKRRLLIFCFILCICIIFIIMTVISARSDKNSSAHSGNKKNEKSIEYNKSDPYKPATEKSGSSQSALSENLNKDSKQSSTKKSLSIKSFQGVNRDSGSNIKQDKIIKQSDGSADNPKIDPSKNIEKNTSDPAKIDINGYTSFESVPDAVWRTDSKEQSVVLKNLEGNSVELAPVIYVDLDNNGDFEDSECIFNKDESIRIKAGEALNAIEINKDIPVGKYNAEVVYKAFEKSSDGKDIPANGVNFNFKIKVE